VDEVISVLTPSFEYGRFIGDAIESVLGQQGVEAEHLVQDGGSSDETVAVLRRYGSAVRWRSEPDAGQSDALNKAFARSRAAWVAWLNADEFFLPGALQGLLRKAEEDSADVVYGDAVLIDKDGRLLRYVPQHRFHSRILRWYGPFFSSCTLLIRRDILPSEPWHPLMARVMDWDLYLALAAAEARFVHLRQPVAAFRVHPDQVTAKPGDAGLADYALVRQRHNVVVRSRSRVTAGKVFHGTFKVQEGAYRRQLAARVLRGRDMRWFRSEPARRAAACLVERCSGRGSWQ
jgi:glycosyltransferase involved in cell wall biosynthesis